ncbi:WD40-repeat-containing domain protein [Armillaria luteobubalina]|uniref:WD40-repeat-containing domain protein n=1 Tax=Armillaria luteobubalina TaxID=153913 RepID=A0AA39Q2A1_9AGAR|nr:WD40-repeat-containing domain protein [Armillaria luteobubalina]
MSVNLLAVLNDDGTPSPEFDEEADRKRPRMLRSVPSRLFALPGGPTASTSMLPPPARASASNTWSDLSLTPSRGRLTSPSASAPPLRHGASFTTFEDLYGSTTSSRTRTRHPELTIWESKTFREKLNSTNPNYVPPTLSRSQSVSSLRSSGPPELHEASAKHHLQKRDVTIDFNPPVSFDDNLPVALACSKNNILFFPRRNRIFYKKLSSNDVATQLCKVKDDKLTAMAIGAFGSEGVESIAIASRAGLIEIWDIETMQKLISFSTKAPTALTWDGPVLTVGNTEGSIRHYDTRLDKDKMKKGSKVIKYHKAMITRIAYNFSASNHMFASGDVDGNVLETSKRKLSQEIKHTAPITAISWAPWNSKLFAAGDKIGLTRVWVVDSTSPISDIVPGRTMDYGTRVVSIHWSCNVKEFLTVHGEITSKYNPSEHGEIPKANTVIAHHYPSLYEIHYVSMGDDVRGNICGSTMNRDETKVVLAVPRPLANPPPPPTEAEIASAAAANAVQAALAAIARATRYASIRTSTTTTTGATPTPEATAVTTVSEEPTIATGGSHHVRADSPCDKGSYYT